MMTVIYCGRRYFVPDDAADDLGLELTTRGNPPAQVRVALNDPDLIMAPSAEDLQLAQAFERGDVSAFQYADGHTYPANRQIARAAGKNTPQRIH